MKTHTGHCSLSDVLAQQEALGDGEGKRSAEEEPFVSGLCFLGLMVP